MVTSTAISKSAHSSAIALATCAPLVSPAQPDSSFKTGSEPALRFGYSLPGRGTKTNGRSNTRLHPSQLIQTSPTLLMNRSYVIPVRYLVVVAFGCLGAAGCGVSRNAAYFELLGQFGNAQRRSPVARGENMPEWRFEVPLAGSGVVARVFGCKGMDVIRVHYSDEREPRTLYEYVDYSNPIDVRVTTSILYIYWSETLLSSKSYVLAYDLQGRRVLAKRRVDPKDVPKS